MKQETAPQIVILYHPKDQSLFEKLQTQLQLLQIPIWDNVNMLAGSEIEKTIHKKLTTATLILPLVSADFIAGEKMVIEAMAKFSTKVFPILLRPCIWEGFFLKKENALPRNKAAITLHKNEDAVLENIARLIQKKMAGEAWDTLLYRADSPNKDLPHGLTNIPPLPALLMGREQDMKGVATALADQKQLLLVSGMGGIGKSALAQTYLHTHRDQYHHIAHITYLSDLPQSLWNSLQLPHPDWQRQDKEVPKAYAQRMFYNMQEMKGNNLLLIDGWDNKDEIHEYKPYIQLPNWTVLITSRTQSNALPRYKLDTLNQAEAKALFEQHCPKAINDPDLPALLQRIEYHTLMIELLAKTMNKAKRITTIAQLITQLDRHQLKAPELQRRINTEHTPKELKLYQHLLATFAIFEFVECADEQSEEEKAFLHIQKNLLLYFSVLPSLPISAENMLTWTKIKEENQVEWEEAIDALADKGWIDRVGNNSYKAHPVIAEALRYQLKPDGKNCEALIISFTWLLNIQEIESGLEKKALIPYIEALIQYIEIEDNYIVNLSVDLALIYKALGEAEQALKFQLKAVEIQEVVLSPKHPDLANSYNNLGQIYKDLGNLQQALKFQLKAIEIQKVILDPEYRILAGFYNNLGLIYYDLNDLQQALKFQLKAVKTQEIILDSKHPDLASSYNNLSYIYKDIGNLQQALKFQLKAVKIRETILVPKHPDLANSYNNLSGVYKVLDNLPQALSYQLKAVGIRETVLPPKHPNLATSYSNLSLIYQDLGNLTKALSYQLKATEIREVIFAPQHPDLATSYNNLSMIYNAVGNMPQALYYQLKAVGIREAILAPQHPSLATSYNNLSTIYQAIGDLPQALGFQLKATEIKEAIFESQHPSLAVSYLNMGKLYVDKKGLKTAKSYINNAVTILQHNFPNGHPHLDKALDWQKRVEELLNKQ